MFSLAGFVRTCGYTNSRNWHKRKETVVTSRDDRQWLHSSRCLIFQTWLLTPRRRSRDQTVHGWIRDLKGSRERHDIMALGSTHMCVNDRFSSRSRRSRHEPSDSAVSNTFRWRKHLQARRPAPHARRRKNTSWNSRRDSTQSGLPKPKENIGLGQIYFP